MPKQVDANSRVMYWRRRRAGQCVRCGERSQTRVCESCKATRADWAFERYEKRVAAGICVRCPEPAAPERVMCSRHGAEDAARKQRSTGVR